MTDHDGQHKPMPSLMHRFLIDALESRLIQAGRDRAAVLALGWDGISKSNLSRFLRGENTPRIGMDGIVEAFATVIGCPPIDLWRQALEEWGEDPDGLTLGARDYSRAQAYDVLVTERRSAKNAAWWRNSPSD